MSDLDNIDRAILRLIAQDASLSLNDIADKVGLTATPCWKRIKRMEESAYPRPDCCVGRRQTRPPRLRLRFG